MTSDPMTPATSSVRSQEIDGNPRLLVPIAVEALIVGVDQSRETWNAVTPRFGLMEFGATLGTMIEPQPFQLATKMPLGVHLKWALPDALTHGVQGQAVAVAELDAHGSLGAVKVLSGGFGYDPKLPPLVLFSGGGGGGASARAVVGQDGSVTAIEILTAGLGYVAAPTIEIGSSEEIRYPRVPNRWIVLRSHADDAGHRVGLKSWVIVSDILTLNEYGRVALGVLPKVLESQLESGQISEPLRLALTDLLGLPIQPTATLMRAPNSTSIWYVRNPGTGATMEAWYSIEIRPSDLLVLGNSAVSWPQIPPNPSTSRVWPPYKYIGRAYPYDHWDGAVPADREKNLTAIGPGDPVFAAAYPNCRSVFGFYDDLSDLPSGGRVTYTVAGWYADPADNPMFGADTEEKWTHRMEELRWCLTQDPGGFPEASICGSQTNEGLTSAVAILPTDILCQGMVYDVVWKGPDAKYVSGVPQGHPDIAIGNTSIEAISALVARKLADEGHTVTPDGIGIEEILEAFQYDILDELAQPDGLVRLEQALHQNAFGRRPGETVWEILPKQTESAEIRKADTAGMPFPPSVGEELTRVNSLQAESTLRRSNLESLQWEMYSAWFRKAMLNQSPISSMTVGRSIRDSFTLFEPAPIIVSREDVEAFRQDADRAQIAGPSITVKQIEAVIERIGKLIDEEKVQLNRVSDELISSVARLTDLVAREMSGYEVMQSPGARYWQGNDPVVLLARDGVKRSFAHGQDAALAEGESLPCRVSGQTVYGLTTPVPGHENQTITQQQLQPYYGNFPVGVPIPGDIEPLFIETLLLDTTMDVLMAVSAWQLAGVSQPTGTQIDAVAAEINSIQTTPLNAYLHAAKRTRLPLLNPQLLSEAVGLKGVYPYKLAVDPWSQPWTPIYVEWDVSWNASYRIPGELRICDTTSDSCSEKWIFDEVDFKWNPKFKPVVGNDPKFAYTGRTVMAPNAPENLAERLWEYLQDHPTSPYYDELQAVYEVVKNLEVLSQSLSGFSNSLTMRRETLQMPVIDYYNRTLGAQVAAAIGEQNQFSPLPDNGYTPLRGGHCKFTRLWVVDAFGQVQRVIEQQQQFNPVLSKPLITRDEPAMIQLTPRVVQPARLSFRWTDARDDARISTSDPATGPIIGWLIPNYFDNSLMFYDGVGKPVGSLQLLQGGLGAGGSGVRWLETPGTVSAVGAQPSLDDPNLNPHLKGFINGLLHYGVDGRQALSELIITLNATLSKIVVTGSAANYGNLPVLIGRPMALLRAALKIDLKGLPDYDESWTALKYYYDQSKFVTGGFTDVEFPVQIGDVRQMRDGVVGYFQGDDYRVFYSKLINPPTVRSGYIQFERRLRLTADPEASAKFVTLVVDPRAPIHIRSDFMPQIEATLPPIGSSTALAAMDLTFRVGPLLSDQNSLSLPLPADIHGNWSWLYHPNVTVWSGAETIVNQDSLARFPQGPKHIDEGWLKLSEALKNGSN